MNKTKIIVMFFLILVVFANSVFGTSVKLNNNLNSMSYKESAQNVENEASKHLEQFMKFESLSSNAIKDIMLKPFKIFVVFLQAFVAVVLINFLSKILCSNILTYSSILKRRKKSRELTKVLKDLYG